jgi:hypothetical protein
LLPKNRKQTIVIIIELFLNYVFVTNSSISESNIDIPLISR